jgi:hypothetical protein
MAGARKNCLHEVICNEIEEFTSIHSLRLAPIRAGARFLIPVKPVATWGLVQEVAIGEPNSEFDCCGQKQRRRGHLQRTREQSQALKSLNLPNISERPRNVGGEFLFEAGCLQIGGNGVDKIKEDTKAHAVESVEQNRILQIVFSDNLRIHSDLAHPSILALG